MSDFGPFRVEPISLGKILQNHRLWVDTNQRNYAWTTVQVEDLYHDFRDTIKSGGEHFVGSIVLSKNNEGKPKIVDGQQRLATTSILLAAMRDFFLQQGGTEGEKRADAYEKMFLRNIHEDTLLPLAHVNLNARDAPFFERYILARPTERITPPQPADMPSSHKLMMEAACVAANQIKEIVKDTSPSEQVERLTLWKNFILEHAKVILIQVPNDATAFMIFETMNDRGVKLSATDLLKNLLFAFGKSSDSKAVEQNWFQMQGAVEGRGKDDVLNFVRYYWLATKSHTTNKTLYKDIRKETQNAGDALQLSRDLCSNAPLYAALLNPKDAKWESYPEDIRRELDELRKLRVTQLRPLLIDGAVVFSKQPEELRRFLASLVNWSVRFLVQGVLGGGVLEKNYGEAARKLHSGAIKTVAELTKEMLGVLPPDALFQETFSQARVSQNHLQRYYLEALEETAREEIGAPERQKEKRIPLSIEHILPEEPDELNWPLVTEEISRTWTNRLGNLALLRKDKNNAIGNAKYADKIATLKDSDFLLTRKAAMYSEWHTKEIGDRQRELGRLAVKTWPLRAV